jgi:tetratricopeptide (TPR) repeat protein
MRHPSFTSAVLLASALSSPLLAQHSHGQRPPTPAARPAPALLEGMGSHHHAISTSSPEAQKFFDQGLTLLYGFNHDEAIRSFERAAELDPSAPMPHWGISLALGMNYNDPQPAIDRLKRAHEQAQRAIELSAGGPANERAYAEAAARRYSADPKADPKALLRDYNAAMGELSKSYPDDLDAATLYAESGMNLRPWKLWKADGSPEEGTAEILAVLESVLKRDPSHPGANHYYIHAVEASLHPERALASASRLQTLVPGAGHLVHMPAHIYMRTGDYLAAEASNAAAADVDRAYLREKGPVGLYGVMYYDHNVHFQSAAAAMAGRYAEARESADRLYADVLPVVSMDPMLEGYLVQPMVVAVRFRKWDEIRAMPDPGPTLPAVRVFWLYGQAVAAAESGDRKKAEKGRAVFQTALQEIPAERLLGPQNSVRAILAVAGHDLDARIARARHDRKAAIESWKLAVAAEGALAYDEPPPWQQPMRESLGAALLADGRAAEAERVFRDDLQKHPRSGRSLLGLEKSLEALGRTSDAGWVRAQFDLAWANADTKIKVEDL